MQQRVRRTSDTAPRAVHAQERLSGTQRIVARLIRIDGEEIAEAGDSEQANSKRREQPTRTTPLINPFG